MENLLHASYSHLISLDWNGFSNGDGKVETGTGSLAEESYVEVRRKGCTSFLYKSDSTLEFRINPVCLLKVGGD